MSEFPTVGLDPKQQRNRMDQLYRLMEKQVKSYHKARHMGENSSVTVELAQELMESILYTLDQVGGMEGNPNLAEGLEKGQRILEQKQSQGEKLLRLAVGTAPQWQGECRWDTVESLERFFRTYDRKHLAHRQPDNLYYPLPSAPPELLKGMDYALFFLRMLWIENQIMDAFPEAEQDRLWDVFCRQNRGMTENQCEQLLVNAMGKLLISGRVTGLTFSDSERNDLEKRLMGQGGEALEAALNRAALQIISFLKTQDPGIASYVRQTASNLLARLAVMDGGNPAAVFL